MKSTERARHDVPAARGVPRFSSSQDEIAGQGTEAPRHAAVTPRLAAPPPAGNPMGCRGGWTVSGRPVDNEPQEALMPPITTDPTTEACRRLFELMDRQPANQRQTTQDPHARMMAAYAAMFGQPHEELDA